MLKDLLSETYFPFGSQYYRAPSPHRDSWEKDLKRMSELGFNMVKFWVQWRWNHPAEDRFDFGDIDELMDISARFGLKVMLNTIFDVAPAWIYRKYPDASMITRDGRAIGPQTQPHRQLGGLGYCFNHPGIMEHFFGFLETTIQRYHDHPALEIWNVGSEPELTSSMAEMRAYADNSDHMGDMLCYCDHCRRAFREWLNGKYGSIVKLNESWNRNYQSFEEVEIPLTRNTFNDMIDWRMFFVHTLGKNVRKRFETAQKVNQGKHPLMCHHVFIQGFPVTSTANDPWNVGHLGDLHGFTQMDDTMMIDILRSCNKNRPVISAEMLMLPGYTLDLPRAIDENDVKRFIFSGIAGNLKGFIFWQYRPEILGREAPTWGLTTLDGETTPWLEAYARTGRVLQKHAEFLLRTEAAPAQIAVLYSPENQIFSWMTTKSEKTVTDSLLGTHRALYEWNYTVDFIHPMELNDTIPDRYKIIYIPFPYLLNRILAGNLRKWVESGGILVGESYFAGWNREHGHHEKTIPGYGFHDVFRVRQKNAEPAGPEGLSIRLSRDLVYLRAGEWLSGAVVRETFFNDGAEVMATYEDGEPAVFRAEYGKGQAILMGSYLGLNAHRKNDLKNRRFLAGLADLAGIQRPLVSGGYRVRVDLLQDDTGAGAMLIIRNLEDIPVSVRIDPQAITAGTYVEQFSGERTGIDKSLDLELSAHEVRVYCRAGS